MKSFSGCLLAFLLLLASPAAAEPPAASAWSQEMYSAIRLVDLGGQDERLAAVEMALKPGFKTYWRYPGDSGVPPQFNWSGSVNLREAEILWPAPKRFSDASGQSIGYADKVSFLVRIVPEDAAKPVVARLAMDYAVCEKLCLPARGAAELTLKPSLRHLQAAMLLGHVPTPALKGFDVHLHSVGNKADKPYILVDVKTPSGYRGGDDLFAEGPDDGWALPLPVRLSHDGPTIRYKILMDGVPRGQPWQGQSLTLTLVTPAGALEKRLALPQ